LAWSQDAAAMFPGGVGSIVASLSKRVADLPRPRQAENLKVLEQSARSHAVEDLARQQKLIQLRQEVDDLVGREARRLRYVAGCPRDLRQCPRHFVATSQSTCKPTDEYEGSCALIELPGAADMEHIAMSCNVEWPCVPGCRRDFSSTCPAGWKQLEDKTCLAPQGYSGQCSPVMSFVGFAVTDKALWAATCQAEWPCLSDAV